MINCNYRLLTISPFFRYKANKMPTASWLALYILDNVAVTPHLQLSPQLCTKYILQFIWNCFEIIKPSHRLFFSYLLVFLKKSVAELFQTGHYCICMCIYHIAKKKRKSKAPTCSGLQLDSVWKNHPGQNSIETRSDSSRETQTRCNKNLACVKQPIPEISGANPDCIAFKISDDSITVPVTINTSTTSLLTMWQVQTLYTCD